MRYFYTFLFSFLACISYSQPIKKTIFSGIIITNDSVPVPDASIINTHTLETTKTDNKGFFQTVMEGNDSLLVHHIAYQKRFINQKHNALYIIVEPEIHQLKEVQINHYNQNALKNNLDNIKELARKHKLSKEEVKSATQRITEQHGSHNDGFSQFFGLTTHAGLNIIGQLVNKYNDKQHRKRATAHYHLVKKKSAKKKE